MELEEDQPFAPTHLLNEVIGMLGPQAGWVELNHARPLLVPTLTPLSSNTDPS